MTAAAAERDLLSECPQWCSVGDDDSLHRNIDDGAPRHWCSVGSVDDEEGCVLEVTISVGASWTATDRPVIKVRIRGGEVVVPSPLARSLAAMVLKAADKVETQPLM